MATTWLSMMAQGLYETVYMTLVSTFMSYMFGLPLGIILTTTDRGHIMPNSWLNNCLGTLVNLVRSVPFLILMVAVLPLSRLILGTTIGSSATIVPLVIGATPFVARMVESSLKEIDKGVIEAAQSMGASPLQIIFKVMLPEAYPSLIKWLSDSHDYHTWIFCHGRSCGRWRPWRFGHKVRISQISD